ncbi:MAG: maltotransferase domain-containing protein, partial [Candidatus Dormibacteria bacterium]
MHSQKSDKRKSERIRRVVIENVRPEIDAGAFAIKRTLGEKVHVTADIHADGHDLLSARLLYRPASEHSWKSTPMLAQGNDAWAGDFPVNVREPHLYTLQAWPDEFKTWARDLTKRKEAGQDLTVEFLLGREVIEAAASRANGADRDRLRAFGAEIEKHHGSDPQQAFEISESEELSGLMDKHADLQAATVYSKELRVEVDRVRARFSAWYEMFPRSCTDDPARHGTFRSCIERLDYIAGMGFDVLYLPPIHPIGEKERKGRDNTTPAAAGDLGSPWAIGSASGGHKSLHPQLGTMADFKLLLAETKKRGMEMALDLAFQCAPDHPYAQEHRE